MKKIIYLIIAAAIVGGVLVIINKGGFGPEKVSAIDKNTAIQGDLSVKRGEKLLVKNGSTVTVNGSLEVKGTLECENGPLNLVVNGNLVVDKNLLCNLGEVASGNPGTGIAIVVTGSVIFNKDAVVASNGHVQIVDSAEKLAKTPQALENIFNSVETDSGTGPQIGPFVSNQTGNTLSQQISGNSPRFRSDNGRLLVLAPIAHAQVPEPCVDKDGKIVPNCVKIGGKWIIGTGENPPLGISVKNPPKGVKDIVLNFDFGPANDFRIEDFSLAGPNGDPGTDDMGHSCDAKGGIGGNAFRVRVAAGKITINDFELWLGDGGRGGHAETIKNCQHGHAKGGNGGKPGDLKIVASNAIDIAGSFIIHPGYGGDGGRATAHGLDGANGCPAKKGGDATATGGDGYNNKKDLRALGAITGLTNVSIEDTRGGHGGEAIADPGKGGSGAGCGCRGGDGGKGTATGGKGGNADLKVLNLVVKTKGGDGGNADSHGGLGGNGGMCNSEGPGGSGGNGGNASSIVGKHGTGKTNGDDGRNLNQAGGNGGNGGDGCLEGKQGNGGSGKPNGKNGLPGKNLCPLPGTSKPEIPTEMVKPDLKSGEPIQPQTPPANNEPPRNESVPSYYQ